MSYPPFVVTLCVLATMPWALAAENSPADNPAIDIISTYIALYDYGYRNAYELGPLIDISASRLELESPAVR